jgi:hypothetical protein
MLVLVVAFGKPQKISGEQRDSNENTVEYQNPL